MKILALVDGSARIVERLPVSTLPEYKAWDAMRSRCYTKRHKNYKNYGLRGIRVCDEWRNDFLQFYLDMGPRPDAKHSIHRIDNEEHYTPANCKWALRPEQDGNKQKTVRVEYGGKNWTLPELATKFGLTRAMLYGRLKMGWPIDVALSAPKGKHVMPRKPVDRSPEAGAERVRRNAANKKHLRKMKRTLA